MTLVLTELSPLGIAMAADSAVTVREGNLSYVEPDAVSKLQKVASLNAGISCWGEGIIEGVSTDQWLADFIATNCHQRDLGSFAEALALRLREALGPSRSKQPCLGFHIAGFEVYQGKFVPSFYHVHDGPSTTLQARGVSVDPALFNANHDMPPAEFVELTATGRAWITRNGDYQLYGQIFGLLEEFFAELLKKGIKIPNSQNLRDRLDYLVFQVRTVSDLYRMSNLIPGIGGPIRFLGISPAGIHCEGTVYA